MDQTDHKDKGVVMKIMILVIIIALFPRFVFAEVHKSLARAIVTEKDKITEYKIERKGTNAMVTKKSGDKSSIVNMGIGDDQPYLFGIDCQKKDSAIRFNERLSRVSLSCREGGSGKLFGRDVVVQDVVVTSGNAGWMGVGKLVEASDDSSTLLQLLELRNGDTRISYSGVRLP